MLVSLDEEKTIFVSDDTFTQDLLSQVSGASFSNSMAIVERLFMRKELVPLLKQAVEGWHV